MKENLCSWKVELIPRNDWMSSRTSLILNKLSEARMWVCACTCGAYTWENYIYHPNSSFLSSAFCSCHCSKHYTCVNSLSFMTTLAGSNIIIPISQVWKLKRRKISQLAQDHRALSGGDNEQSKLYWQRHSLSLTLLICGIRTSDEQCLRLE